MNHVKRVSTAILPGIGLALLGATASAVDLRDWGRKYVASERFIVLPQFNNQAVLDKETQLVWQRSVGFNAANWAAAMGACRGVFAGGRGGWRLPSISELQSLAADNGVLPTGHPFQNLPSNGNFWSSTELASDATRVYAGTPMIGGLYHQPLKTNTSYYILCVRGPSAE